ncbi:MAG: hypothetical protein V1776_02955 [Candidatus Diapherotrites archaeon]
MTTPKLNERAFTLFTALLSFILILLAGLLVNTMISAERSSNQVVLEIEAQSRMQSLADLTRADALQVVNYGIRNAIEEYTRNEGNAYRYSSATLDWQQVKDDFSKFFFGGPTGSVLAGRIAANLHVIVQSQPKQISGYTITVKGGTEPQLKAAIQDVLLKTSGTGSDFLQVVNCAEEKPPIECVGTFYVNLDFSMIDDTTYESLPAIHVYDNSTGRELVEPVIPRGKFRIYVPLRIFRALRYAHDIAHGPLGNTGLLSPDFHSNLDKLGVGMCDSVDTSGGIAVENCAYRTKPFTPASPTTVGPDPPSPPITGGNLCPAEESGLSMLESAYPHNVPLMCDGIASSLGLCAGGSSIAYYNPFDAISRANALNQLVKDIIGTKVTVDLSMPETSDFKLLTGSVIIEPKVSSFPSKIIQFEGLAGVPIKSEAKCTKLVETNVTLTFEESNTNYIVVDTRAPLRYDVRIVDTFIKTEGAPGVCVSYCLEDVGIGTFIFGPDLAGSASVCPKTACAPPNTHGMQPTCGNGVQDAGEECDSDNLFGGTCETQGKVSGILACNNSTCTYDTSGCLDAP